MAATREFDLLQVERNRIRPIATRKKAKDESRTLALQFGREYFDGTREQGYGGYRYDGRWIPVARRAIAHWGLQPGDRVLDIGCAKGFFVKDLRDVLPGLDAIGVDISNYALLNAHPDVTPHLFKASCDELPFPDSSFAAVFAINTIHNLDQAGCARALREIERVCPGRGFVQVDAYRTETERELFLDWMLTAKTFDTPAGWQGIFEAEGYKGEYWWTILEQENATSGRR